MKIENTIYLDHQASTPVDPQVMEAMMPYWRGTFANPHSTEHVLGQKAALAVLERQAHIASLIGAQPQEIISHPGRLRPITWPFLDWQDDSSKDLVNGCYLAPLSTKAFWLPNLRCKHWAIALS